MRQNSMIDYTNICLWLKNYQDRFINKKVVDEIEKHFENEFFILFSPGKSTSGIK